MPELTLPTITFGEMNEQGQVKDRFGTWRDVLYIDYETFFASKYSLQSLTYAEYFNDGRFKFHGVGIAINNGEIEYYTTEQVAMIIRDLPVEKMIMVGANLMFDASLTVWAFGKLAFEYHDIMNFGRAYWPGQGASLGAMAKRAFPNDPSKQKGFELADFKNKRDLNEKQQAVMGGYCKQDIHVTRCLYKEVLLPAMPRNEIRLAHETLMLYVRPVFDADFELLQEAYDEEVKGTKDKVKASGYAKTRLSSNKQFVELIESLPDIKGDIPTKESPTTGKLTYALGQKDPAFITFMAENAQYQPIWDARQAVKSTLIEKRAQRLIDLAKASHGKLPVALNYFGAHCVPGETEVLTELGWQRIDEWQGGRIAQVNEQQEIIFDQASRFVGPETDQWLKVDAPYVPALFTRGHKVPYLTHGSFKWRELPAAAMQDKGSFYMPTSGKLQSLGYLTADAMRVLVMIQADGHFTSYGQLQIFLGKERKQERARQLLEESGVKYRELQFDSHPGHIRFVVSRKDFPIWLCPEHKTFGPWLLDSTPGAREAFITELVHWDGWTNSGCQVAYGTTDKYNADWVATLCHLTGRSASIHEKPQRGNRKLMYEVIIREHNYTMVKRHHWSNDDTLRQTYCTETKTGYWLARYNGRIFVTGNTGRWSGCLTAETEIIILRNGAITNVSITEVRLSDLVWDGEEFVTHEGVVFSGYRNVIEHDGVRGTPDHVVFTENGEKPLAEAKAAGECIKSAQLPAQYKVD